MENSRSVEVAVVGSGRRARLLCRVLTQMRRVRKVHLVAQDNARGMHAWLASEKLGHRVALHARLDPVLWSGGVAAAVVANRPADHFPTARWLLENGKHVLVEKPFARTRSEAQALADLAEARGLVAAAGFELFLASYLHHFRSVVHNHGHPHPIDRTEITWHESMAEQGWGAPRPPAAGRHAIADLLPHALTLLTVLFGRLPARTVRVLPPESESAAQIDLAFGAHPVHVSLACAAAEPRRAIRIATRGGPAFMLDFTTEPGAVTQDGRALPGDSLWDALPRPLPAAIAHFLDEVAERRGNLPLPARQAMSIVEATEEALARAREPKPAAPRAEGLPGYALPLAGSAPAVAVGPR
jgi:predicted dehydrogenase